MQHYGEATDVPGHRPDRRPSPGDGVDALEREILAALPEGRAALSGRLPDRSDRANAGRRAHPREGAAPHARRTAVHDRRSSSTSSRSRARRRPDAHPRVDPRRHRLAEAHRRRQGRRHDQDASAPRRARTSKRCSAARSSSTSTSRCASDWRDDERILDEMGLGRARDDTGRPYARVVDACRSDRHGQTPVRRRSPQQP